MRLLSLIGTKAPVQAFARKLVEDIAKRYPVPIDQDLTKRPSANRLTRIVEDACAQASEFAAEHRLGVLGKAKLGNAVRWELTERGYRMDFVDLATEAVVVHVSRRKGS
jgi:hypothetical protein